ncbi:unnamed protein product [Porites evermanni]|uniref:XPG N-terminal domain-containing protein n=1 Tax=Porites evermanni TaxID=104178 RepID=A0ABN8MNU6_9CNID|nr:unnamed protein product [Porites evermanni]
MGITGLLPLLKDITCDVHVRSLSGKVAAIDVYCWLHETVIFCVEEIILGSKQRGTYQHFDTDLLIENNVQPILVFQKKLEGKANVESSPLTCCC